MKCRIRNWSKYQHYKDRNPPWVKLHFEILASADWVMLSDASRLLAIVCMLLASRSEGGLVDCSPKGLAYMKRIAYLDAVPDIDPLVECGFLEPASNVLADATACLNRDRDRPETEAKADTDTKADAEQSSDSERITEQIKQMKANRQSISNGQADTDTSDDALGF